MYNLYILISHYFELGPFKKNPKQSKNNNNKTLDQKKEGVQRKVMVKVTEKLSWD